jgi:hypothetical protein
MGTGLLTIAPWTTFWRIGLLSLGLLVLAAEDARAADAQQRFAIHGAGAETCQQVIDTTSKDKSAGLIVGSWIFGYLTAANRVAPDRFDITPILDPSTLVNAIYLDCTRHPSLPLQIVVAGFLDELDKAGVRTESPIVTVKAGGKMVQIRTETLATIQTALAAQGRYDGKPDGVFGPKLEAALRAYQHEGKLPETGLPDAATILRLLVERPAGAPAKP